MKTGREDKDKETTLAIEVTRKRDGNVVGRLENIGRNEEWQEFSTRVVRVKMTRELPVNEINEYELCVIAIRTLNSVRDRWEAVLTATALDDRGKMSVVTNGALIQLPDRLTRPRQVIQRFGLDLQRQ
jgi:hypothetical protein